MSSDVESIERLDVADPARRLRTCRAPAWLVSMALHGLILLSVAGAAIRVGKGLPDSREKAVPVGVVVRNESPQPILFEHQQPTLDAQPQSDFGAGPVKATGETPESDKAPALSASAELAPLASMNRSLLDTRAAVPGINMSSGGTGSGIGAGSGGGPGGGGTGRSMIFPQAPGKRFVWVIDRSASMGYCNALEFAKRELVASLIGLQTQSSFQIVFYSSRPNVMPLGDGRLVTASAQNVEKAKSFVKDIEADGATLHTPALMKAFEMKPEVVFFLTDADDMKLEEVRTLTAANRRASVPATIHAIEFGAGPQVAADKPMRLLASENDGTYTYFDVRKIDSAR